MLQDEIEKTQRAVRTDAYQMSIGEIVSQYREGELVINPDFQRLFRWEIGQKSRLIESILLGIPLPSIFVFERDDTKWELIDGLQRISTVLEFMGLLKDPDTNKVLPPSALVATKYLPSLHNVVWQKSKEIIDPPFAKQVPLDKSLQLAVRRARLGVEILKRPSDNKAKYDLFQRLNAGGTPANAQELRNCIIIMVSNKFFKALKEMAQLDSFSQVIASTDEQIERQRHMEYATRFLVHTYVKYDGTLDVEEYIDDGIVKLATEAKVEEMRDCMKDTFGYLNEAFGSQALRRLEHGKHSGRVSLAAFECIAVGIGKNIKKIRRKPDPIKYIKERITRFWRQPDLDGFFSPGLRGTTRILRTIPFGEEWFAK